MDDAVTKLRQRVAKVLPDEWGVFLPNAIGDVLNDLIDAVIELADDRDVLRVRLSDLTYRVAALDQGRVD